MSKFSEANLLLRKGSYDQAIAIYKRLSDLQPDFDCYLKNKVHALNLLQNQYSDLPTFSIILPVYNRCDSLYKAIMSIVNQSYYNWELIVVDDGSEDDFESILKIFSTLKKFKYYKIERSGVSCARNFGLSKSIGKYITYLDSDNTWLPNYLQDLSDVYLGDFVKAAYAGLNLIGDNETVVYKFDGFDIEKLRNKNFIDLNVYSHSRLVYEELGGFDDLLFRMVDWDLILKYSIKYRPAEINRPCCNYYDGEHGGRITKTIESSFLTVKHRYTPLVDWVELSCRRYISNMVSVIVPFLDNSDLTIACIESLRRVGTRYKLQIIIIDNGSTSNESNLVRSYALNFSDVVFHRNSSNLNYSYGNNVGMNYVKGEHVVFLNNDTVVTDGWLDVLIDKLIEDLSVGFVQPLLLYPDGDVQCSVVVFNSFSAVPYHLYSNVKGTDRRVLYGRYVNAATAACLAMRTADVVTVNGFDPIFVNGCEDTDLCLRINRDLGKRGYYEPASVVYHHESKSKGRMKYFNNNRMALCRRWNNRHPQDDVHHMMRDGLIAVEYQPKEGLVKGFPWIRRVDNPKFIPTDFLRNDFHILISKPSGIGNMMMFMPALMAIRRKYPASKISVLCYFAESLILKGRVNEVIVLNRNQNGSPDLDQLNLLMKNRKFDCVLYPPFSSIGKPNDILMKVSDRHFTHPFISFESRHEVLHNNDIARMLGVDFDIDDFRFNDAIIPSDNRSPYVCLHVGSSSSIHMRKKRWSLDKWVKLIEIIVRDFKLNVILIGGVDDKIDGEYIYSNLPSSILDSVELLVEKVSFDRLPSLISLARAFISGDSGLMHVAAATETPLIAIFGPTNPVKNKPWRKNKVHLLRASGVSCSPCYTNEATKLISCEKQKCLESIDVQSVVDALHVILDIDIQGFLN